MVVLCAASSPSFTDAAGSCPPEAVMTEQLPALTSLEPLRSRVMSRLETSIEMPVLMEIV